MQPSYTATFTLQSYQKRYPDVIFSPDGKPYLVLYEEDKSDPTGDGSFVCHVSLVEIEKCST